MSIFSTKECLLCAEKEKLISALTSQVEMLNKLVFPKTQYNQTIEVEANALLNGQDEPIKLDAEASREASLLLSGDYEESFE